MLYHKALIDRLAEQPDAAKYDYDYSKRAYEFGSAYDIEEFLMEVGPGVFYRDRCSMGTDSDGNQAYTCTHHLIENGVERDLSDEEFAAMLAAAHAGGEHAEGDKDPWTTGDYDWVTDKISVHESADGRVTIEMWSANAMRVASGLAAAVSVAMSLA